MMRKLFLTSVFCIAAIAPALAQDTPAPEGALVYIVSPADGATVTSPVTVIFGLRGMGVAPAEVHVENTGHHHLLIDRAPFGEGPGGEEEFVLALPADDNHRHFGGGQTEVTLDLAPGTRTLQLVIGDAGHVPHVPPIFSEVVTITVE
jgi:hypothetical protein